MLERGLTEPPSTKIECMVCEKYDQWCWVDYSKRAKFRGLHCEQHKAQFHSVGAVTWNCCDKPYHPMNDYEWRPARPVNNGVPPLDVHLQIIDALS